jgi:hypothetical protein
MLEESGDLGWMAFNHVSDQQPVDLRHIISASSPVEKFTGGKYLKLYRAFCCWQPAYT